MPAVIDYFSTATSPYVYLGHRELLDIAGRTGAKIRYRPVNLPGVWAESGAVPLPQRPIARQNYRLIELQRWRERRGVPLNLHPAHFPTAPDLANLSVISIQEEGGDPGEFAGRVSRAIWSEEKNVADEGVITALLTDCGFNAAQIVAHAGSEEARAVYERNTEDAINFGAVGVPCYVLNGEAFWGQDRLDFLEDALASDREPYRPA